MYEKLDNQSKYYGSYKYDIQIAWNLSQHAIINERRTEVLQSSSGLQIMSSRERDCSPQAPAFFVRENVIQLKTHMSKWSQYDLFSYIALPSLLFNRFYCSRIKIYIKLDTIAWSV